MRAHGLRDLHRERSHIARCAHDQHPVPRLRCAALAGPQSLQRQDLEVARTRRSSCPPGSARRHPPGRYVLCERPAAVVGQVGHHRIPGCHRVTPAPTDSISPATSQPIFGSRGRRNPGAGGRNRVAVSASQVRAVDRCRPHPDLPSPGTGLSISRISTTSGPAILPPCEAASLASRADAIGRLVRRPPALSTPFVMHGCTGSVPRAGSTQGTAFSDASAEVPSRATRSPTRQILRDS